MTRIKTKEILNDQEKNKRDIKWPEEKQKRYLRDIKWQKKDKQWSAKHNTENLRSSKVNLTNNRELVCSGRIISSC
jgi:hypothetical protein